MSLRQIMMAASKPYRRLDYLRSTGTQYIDTGILANWDYTIEAKFKLNSSPSTYAAGIIGGGNYPRMLFVSARQSTSSVLFRYYEYGDIFTGVDFSQMHTIRMGKGNCALDGDGISLGSYQFTASENIWIFATNSNWSPYKGDVEICEAKVYDGNGTLLQEFSPALWRANHPYVDGNTGLSVIPTADKPGMLDLVTGRLFTNRGSSEFLYQ